MKKHVVKIVSLVGFTVAVAGCGLNPTAGEFGDKAGNAICAKLEMCEPAGFEAAHMNVANCVSTFTTALFLGEFAREDEIACDAATADKCYDELSAIVCPMDVSQLDIAGAASCQGC